MVDAQSTVVAGSTFFWASDLETTCSTGVDHPVEQVIDHDSPEQKDLNSTGQHLDSKSSKS